MVTATHGARTPAAAASASSAVATISATVPTDLRFIVGLYLYMDSAKIYGSISTRVFFLR